MKNLIFCLLFSCVLITAAFATATEKIPVTTSSEKAKQAYLKGQDYADKLMPFEALQSFQKAVVEDPQMAVGYLNVAFNAQSAKGFFDNVAKAVALAGNVSEGERLWILGVEAGAGGYPKKQLECYQKLVAAYPKDERAHTYLATAYFGLQQYDDAITEFQKSLAINSRYSTPYNLLGYAYRLQEKYEDSERAFKKYIELVPGDPNPYDSYAELLMKVGRYDESIENYRKALAIDPHFINSRIGIATNYDFKGDYENASKELQVLFDSARNNGERRAALAAMTVSYVQQGNMEKAIAQQETMYSIAEKTKDAAAMSGDLNTVGFLLLESNKPDQAKQKYQRGLAVILESKLSDDVKENAKRFNLYNLAQVAIAKKDLTTAKSLAEDFRKQAQSAGNQFQLWLAHELAGRIAMEEKDFDLAVAELQQSNQQNPQNLYRIAIAYEAKGDKTKANVMYKKVTAFNGLSNLNYSFVRSSAQKKVS